MAFTLKSYLLLFGLMLALFFTPVPLASSVGLAEPALQHRLDAEARSAFSLEAEERASFERMALAEHIAVKYRRPIEAVARIVTAAYQEGLAVGLPPLMLLAIIEKESGFRADVVNWYGAVGLMQVVPRFHLERFAPGDPVVQLQRPETNIRVGARILAEYLRSSRGDLTKALTRYSGRAPTYAEQVFKLKANLERAYSPAA